MTKAPKGIIERCKITKSRDVVAFSPWIIADNVTMPKIEATNKLTKLVALFPKKSSDEENIATFFSSISIFERNSF